MVITGQSTTMSRVTLRVKGYESIIEDQVIEMDQAAGNICSGFNLFIPVLASLKLPIRIGSIRCPHLK